MITTKQIRPYNTTVGSFNIENSTTKVVYYIETLNETKRKEAQNWQQKLHLK